MKTIVRPSMTRYRVMIAGRFFIALVGGYGISAYSAKWIALSSLSSPASAAMAASLLGFLIYTFMVLWVFAVRSTVKAWAGVAISFAAVYAGYLSAVN